ncbi:hypothetical protein GIB67_021256 [Kingdonia uniflora]|uniref:Splicing factor U2af large subunit n=1 Tax=Kingdonia uniflora TaxID=39325 RepID=A0A7J7LFX8_9MAGN|nr:hypothetical protein GIB67_021256 [Kingdonia uniflora]
MIHDLILRTQTRSVVDVDLNLTQEPDDTVGDAMTMMVVQEDPIILPHQDELEYRIRAQMSNYETRYEANGDKGGDHGGSSPYDAFEDRELQPKQHSRGSDYDRSRIKERGDREKDRDRHHRDHKDRGLRDERGREKHDDYVRHRSRDNDRHRDYDRGRDRRHRRRSHSRSGDGSTRNRSRSRSRSPSKSKRASGFDMAPPGATMLPGGTVPGQMPGVPQMMPGMFSNMFPLGPTMVPLMPAQAMTQQATRHARRVYVGGLPPLANEQGVSVRVRRPTDYNPSLAAALGPSQPNPLLNLGAVGLTPGATGGVEGPDRIFVGGLPYYFTEAQIKELLESFGALRGFDLVKDRDTGNSKGYGFCVYQDPAVTDIACAALNGLKMGDKTLTVRRATASSGQSKDQESILQQAQQHIAIQKMVLQATGTNLPGIGMPMFEDSEIPTKVVCLTEVVSADELREDEDYNDILVDMREEGGKFGSLMNVVIPRPEENGEQLPGVGKVFLEYSDISGSTKAKIALHGRKFGGNDVIAVYYPEDNYFNGDYGA